MSVQIIVDSTVDMPERMKDRFRIVPLTVHFGAEEFIDGVTIDKHRFYERLVESDELPTTSQATPAAFDKEFAEVAAAGDSAVVVTLASKFSGTYQSACIAAAEYDNIYVVDSKSAAIGSGILAEYALKCADKGMDAKTIAETLEKKRDEICLVALLDTLEYLKKGGRISKTVAFAGGLLNIKPVITVVDGEIQVIGKARGSKQGNNLLVQKIHESGGIDFDEPIILGYSGLSDSYLKNTSRTAVTSGRARRTRSTRRSFAASSARTPVLVWWLWHFSRKTEIMRKRSFPTGNGRFCIC